MLFELIKRDVVVPVSLDIKSLMHPISNLHIVQRVCLVQPKFHFSLSETNWNEIRYNAHVARVRT